MNDLVRNFSRKLIPLTAVISLLSAQFSSMAQGWRSLGIDVSAWRPKLLTDDDIRKATQVVSLATELPATKPLARPKLLEWNDIPPIGADYARAQQAILERVEALVKSLSVAQKR